MTKINALLLFCFIILGNVAYSQTDSLIFNNGNYIVGEIKSMSKGILVIETDYSESDFNIEWEGIKEVYSPNYFLFILSDKRRINGSLETTEDGKVNILGILRMVQVNADEIVYIKIR